MHFQLDEETPAFRDEVCAQLLGVLTPDFEERLTAVARARRRVRPGPRRERTILPRRARRVRRTEPQSMGRTGRQRGDHAFRRAGVPVRDDTNGGLSDQRGGTQEMREGIVAGAINGDITIALGFTEPECGSDVAAAKTKAVAGEGGHNGSKMFTTNGYIAEHVSCLPAPTPRSKHQGLTMFLVPLDSDGVEAQAVWTLSGSGRTSPSTATSASETSAGWRGRRRLAGPRDVPARRARVRMGPHLVRLFDHAEHWATSTLTDAAPYPSRIATSGADWPGLRSRQRCRSCSSGGSLDDRGGPDSGRRGPDVQGVQH